MKTHNFMIGLPFALEIAYTLLVMVDVRRFRKNMSACELLYSKIYSK